MPLFTKLNSIRSSVHLPFVSKQPTSPPPSPQTSRHDSQTTSPYSRSSLSASNLSRNQQPQPQPQSVVSSGIQRQRTISTPTISFAETLKVMSKQVQQTQFDDVFDSFFFTEKRCRNRAIFMAARLAQNLGSDLAQLHQQHAATTTTTTTTTTTINSFWKQVMDRLYTLNYLLFVVPADDRTRTQYLKALIQTMDDDTIGKGLKGRRGGMEIYFALCHSIKKAPTRSTRIHDDWDTMSLMEEARKIVEHCLDSEDKLGHNERDAMYIFHGLRAGFHDGQYDPTVAMDDDDSLLVIIQQAIQENKNLTGRTYVNPFEDDACIVDSDDDADLDHKLESGKSRQADSGFYEAMV